MIRCWQRRPNVHNVVCWFLVANSLLRCHVVEIDKVISDANEFLISQSQLRWANNSRLLSEIPFEMGRLVYPNNLM